MQPTMRIARRSAALLLPRALLLGQTDGRTDGHRAVLIRLPQNSHIAECNPLGVSTARKCSHAKRSQPVAFCICFCWHYIEHFAGLWFFISPQQGSAELLSVRLHISKTRCPNFTKFSVHVTRRRGSVLLWHRCDKLCTSGSVKCGPGTPSFIA